MTSEPAQRIEMRINTSAEVAIAIICGIGFPLMTWEAIAGFAHLTPHDFDGMRSAGLGKLMLALIGPLGFRLLAALFAFIAGPTCIGAIWRLLDHGPTLVAEASDIVFHPSLCRRPLSWDDIKQVSLSKGPNTHFCVELHSWHMSLYAPLPSKMIKVSNIALGITYRQAESNMRQMRRWQRAFDKSPPD